MSVFCQCCVAFMVAAIKWSVAPESPGSGIRGINQFIVLVPRTWLPIPRVPRYVYFRQTTVEFVLLDNNTGKFR